MTPYAIFAIALTIAYIVYYGYNISKDIYGKKGENKDSVEEFEVGPVAGGEEIVATPVREMDGGFTLGDSAILHADGPDIPQDNDAQPDKYSDLGDSLEDADIQSEGGKTEPDMIEWMIRQRPNPTDVFRRSKITETREKY